jgi:hypothetical protein
MRRFDSIEKSDNGSYIRAMGTDNSNIRLRERSNTSFNLNVVPNDSDLSRNEEDSVFVATSRF